MSWFKVPLNVVVMQQDYVRLNQLKRHPRGVLRSLKVGARTIWAKETGQNLVGMGRALIAPLRIGLRKAGVPLELNTALTDLYVEDGNRVRRISASTGVISTVAGDVASDLEDHAAQGRLEEARPLLEQLETMTQELMRLAGGLSIDTLRSQAGAARDMPRHRTRDDETGEASA